MTENIYDIIREKLLDSGLDYSYDPFKGESNLYHFLYVVHNNVDNRFYVGIHSAKTLRDSYRGSGKLLKRAIKKYGFAKFTIDRHVFFKDRVSLSKAEGLIVTLDLLKQYQGIIYNLRTGGDYEFFDPEQGNRVRNHWYSNDQVGQAMRKAFEKAKAHHDEYINSEKGIAMRRAASEHMKELWRNPEWRAKMEEKKRTARIKHQKENPGFLKQCSEKARLINMKPVAQALELYGTPVKVWECQKYIPKDIISHSLLVKALKDRKPVNGYYWFYYHEEDRKYKPLERDIAKADKTLKELVPYAITEQQAQTIKTAVCVSRTYQGIPELYFKSTSVVITAYGATGFPQGYLNTNSLCRGLYWRYVHVRDKEKELQQKQQQTLALIEDFKSNRLEEWLQIEKQMGKRIKHQKVVMMDDPNGTIIETFTSYSQAAFVLGINSNQFSSTIRQTKIRYKGFYWKTVNDQC